MDGEGERSADFSRRVTLHTPTKVGAPLRFDRFREGDGAEEGFGFGDGLVVLVGGVGVGDDSGACLDVGLAVF
jgi:hypothetical protein